MGIQGYGFRACKAEPVHDYLPCVVAHLQGYQVGQQVMSCPDQGTIPDLDERVAYRKYHQAHPARKHAEGNPCSWPNHLCFRHKEGIAPGVGVSNTAWAWELGFRVEATITLPLKH